MRLRDQITALRIEINAVASANGARDVRVFGSVARGEERPDSDVDLLVRLDSGRTLMDLARLEAELERLLSRSVDVMPETALRAPVREAALRDAVNV